MDLNKWCKQHLFVQAIRLHGLKCKNPKCFFLCEESVKITSSPVGFNAINCHKPQVCRVTILAASYMTCQCRVPAMAYVTKMFANPLAQLSHSFTYVFESALAAGSIYYRGRLVVKVMVDMKLSSCFIGPKGSTCLNIFYTATD